MPNVPFTVSESYGTIVARRTATEPSVPGALLAAARRSNSEREGWYVSFHQAHHLIYVQGEAEARRMLTLVAGELVTGLGA